MKSGIVCAGHIIVDLVKIIDHWPKEGMLVSITDEKQHCGGLVCNCLNDLAIIDPSLSLHAIGVVGNDQYGQYAVQAMSKDGINCEHISTLDSTSTSFTDVMTVKNGQRTFFHMEGANALLDVDHIIENTLSPKIFHLGYIALLKTLDQPDRDYGTKAARVLKIMTERGCKTSLDLVSVSHPEYKKLVSAALPHTDYLIINEIEAGMATGLTLRDKSGTLQADTTRQAADILLKGGVKELVIIHFPEGGYGINIKEEHIFCPSCVIDTSEILGTVGAGDAFCAGVLYGLHQGYSLEKCIQFANGVARFSLLDETSTGGVKSAATILQYIENAEVNKNIFA